MQITPIHFDAALAGSEEGPRHILLGNGFSIGACSQFAYASLMDEGRKRNPRIGELLLRYGATDFEDGLRRAPADLVDEIRATFVRTLADLHPLRSSVPQPHRQFAAEFLAHFRRPKEHPHRGVIFTTNYDAVLSWLLMEFKERIHSMDGFDNRLEWHASRGGRAEVQYLHGALHHYEGPEPRGRFVLVQKLKADGFRALPDVIRDALNAGSVPLIVSEGGAAEKTARIEASPYLSVAMRRFKALCDRESDSIFTYGHRLAEVDAHIAAVIGRGRMKEVFVGVLDPADAEYASALAAQWQLDRNREGLGPLKVTLYDSSTARAWGPLESRFHK